MGELFMSMLKSGLSYRLDAEIRYLEDFFAAKKRVFLYGGTGEAKKILEILALAELKPSGIIVSDGCRKDNVLYGLKVVETSEISLDETADGIIMAVKSMRNSLDVLATIREHWGGYKYTGEEQKPFCQMRAITCRWRWEREKAGRISETFTSWMI